MRVRGVHLAVVTVVGVLLAAIRATYVGTVWMLYAWPFLLVLAGVPALYLVRKRVEAQRALTTLQGERAWATRTEVAARGRGLGDVAASLEAERREGVPSPLSLAQADAAVADAAKRQDKTSPRRV